MNQIFLDKLKTIVAEDKILIDEPMKKHTTFRVGGPADYFIMPSSNEEVKQVIDLCKESGILYYVIGNGSNLLVSDKGYRGAIIQMYRGFADVTVDGKEITASAGASLAKIANVALDNELAGFEFAAGIPGTLGGACVMNAGAYGGEMKDVLKSVTVINQEGEIITIPREDLELGYRTSIIAKKGYVVLEAVIELHDGKKEEIKAIMDDLKERRTTKQPLDYPSAGSTFKRPEGYFAGKLIQDTGLRGFRVGDAQVSEKHCGFVINVREATAEDINSLIAQVVEKVHAKFGVTLEPEVKKLGEF